MSREQKEELIKLLEQKAIKQREMALESFKPNPGAQEAFFKSNKKIRMLIGGNGLGKTTCLVIELLYTHLKQHPYREVSLTRHSWVVVPGLDKIEDYWREIKKWCPPSKLPETDKMGSSSIRRLRWKNGDMTTFYSVDQDPAKLEGTNFDMLLIDEPPPRALYIAAYRGLRNNPHYSISFACTPISEPWLYTELYQPAMLGKDKNIQVFVGSTYENTHLSKDFIEDFKSRLTEDEIRTRIYGEFAVLQGRVFKEFERHRHVIKTQEWPKDWPVWVGIDPHTRKPNTAVYVGVTPDDNLVVINEVVEEGIEEFATKVKQVEKDNGYRIISRIIDTAGNNLDWTRETAVDHLIKAGIRTTPARKGKGSVDDGIHRIKVLLKGEPNQHGILVPRAKFFDSVTHTINDMELYSWHDSRKPEVTGVAEKPRKVHDDMIDPLRYVILARPIFHCAVESQYLAGAPAKKQKAQSPFNQALINIFNKD